MICLIGDILTDVNLSAQPEPKMRLGGIIHAARALWAMDIDYTVAYFAPSYMEEHISNCLKQYNCKEGIRLGEVVNNPYVMLFKEAKEIGDQGYEFLYRDTINIKYYEDHLSRLSSFDEIFIISGSYNINTIFKHLNSTQRIYLDCANDIESSEHLCNSFPLEILFISTSSSIFRNEYSTFSEFCEIFRTRTKNLIIKENRGGSIWYEYSTLSKTEIPCYLSEISHSVGVGDVFDVVSIALHGESLENSLYRASWIAKIYAETTFVDDFKRNVKRSLKGDVMSLKSLDGCILPWEIRQKCHIYLAAPDFNHVDSFSFDHLEECLSYHNFVLHRPIKENGQLPLRADKAKSRELFNKDMELLGRCNMVIAMLPFNDPGTLIEIGIACERRIPTILFDSDKQAYNCMLTELPDKICTDWDELICEIFSTYSKMYKNGVI